MRKGFLILALGLFAAAGTAAADDLALPETGTPPDAPAPVTLPAKGTTMGAVKKQFGEPRGMHGPVGGDTPKHPPITRWDYETFVVIFEKDRVIDAVVPGAPPKLRSTAGLTRATDAPPAPGFMPAPEAPAEEAPPPMEPSAEAAPIIPEAPAEAPPAEAAPAEAPPAESAPAQSAPAEAAPAEPTPPPAEPTEYSDDQPPTPK
jgi:hypothetical protein